MNSKYLKLCYQKVHYLEDGKGKTIVLLPSFLLTSYSYQYVVRKLLTSYRVIIPDIYKGRSVINTLPDSIDLYADELMEFLKKMKINKCLLIGISFSGIIVNRLYFRNIKEIEEILILNSTVADVTVKNYFNRLISGYCRLLFNNFLTFQGNAVNFLWIKDFFIYLFNNSRQLANEIKIGVVSYNQNQVRSVPVKTKMIFSLEDEFITPDFWEKHKQYSNINIEILPGNHDWFFHSPDLFANKVKEYFEGK